MLQVFESKPAPEYCGKTETPTSTRENSLASFRDAFRQTGAGGGTSIFKTILCDVLGFFLASWLSGWDLQRACV